jgi:hypothetical protein
LSYPGCDISSILDIVKCSIGTDHTLNVYQKINQIVGLSTQSVFLFDGDNRFVKVEEQAETGEDNLISSEECFLMESDVV